MYIIYVHVHSMVTLVNYAVENSPHRFRFSSDRPALLSQKSLPVLTICCTTRHGAQQVRVDLNHLVCLLCI